MLIHLEKEMDFKKEISEGVILVDFFASWCGPCKMLTPELEEFSAKNPDIKVVKVNIDDFGQLASEYNVRVVPTLFVFKDGKEVKTSSGFMDAGALENFVK
ncbi:MAG TPA: thioredoxin [Candidatus Onthovivens sp.]|nr:thioredoxin [Candidatus Onthovivens sp.]